MADPEIEKRKKMLIEESQGIWPMFEAFYLESIVLTAQTAIAAFQRYDEALLKSDSSGIVATLQEALVHSASLSRFFWPSPRDRTGVAATRGEKLRKAFGLKDDSALQGRELRDALEHFDERLDEFLLEEHVGNFLPTPVIGDVSFSDNHLLHVFRLVDPKKEIFVLFGKPYEFGSLRKEVGSLLKNARRMNSDGGILEQNSKEDPSSQ